MKLFVGEVVFLQLLLRLLAGLEKFEKAWSGKLARRTSVFFFFLGA